MEQELKSKRIAIVGCGAAGGFASVLLCKNPCVEVVAFDLNEPFATLLPTGGGRCNLTYEENDVREFVKNYPRGEKFLISIFTRFGVEKTRKLFRDLGIKTYVQEDNRVFPVSDSSKKTIDALQKHLLTTNFKHIKEKVISIKKESDFIVETSQNTYTFDYVVVTTGGKGNGFDIASSLGHNIIPPQPSLCALDIKEKFLYMLSGLSFKNVEISAKVGKKKLPIVNGDILFSHRALTGPVIFKVSALSAFENVSDLELTIKLLDLSVDEIENYISLNQKKTIKNVFSKFVPESYISVILSEHKIDGNKQIAQIKKIEKEILVNSILCLRVHAISRVKDSEIVTAGGVDLNEINSKTMESKILGGLYFAGEVLNIDAYTGGFNLQNCWSTSWIVSSNFN